MLHQVKELVISDARLDFLNIRFSYRLHEPFQNVSELDNRNAATNLNF
ncbi:MAG: hypothetical protein ACFCUU_18705 [Cyclobacteriaceae bacterium]